MSILENKPQPTSPILSLPHRTSSNLNQPLLPTRNLNLEPTWPACLSWCPTSSPPSPCWRWPRCRTRSCRPQSWWTWHGLGGRGVYQSQAGREYVQPLVSSYSGNWATLLPQVQPCNGVIMLHHNCLLLQVVGHLVTILLLVQPHHHICVLQDPCDHQNPSSSS